MPPPISDDNIAKLSEKIFQRRKIEAIKLYRELTGCGLKEAKDEVEQLEATLRRDSPDRFAGVAQRKGCMGSAAMLGGTVLIGTACYWFWRG